MSQQQYMGATLLLNKLKRYPTWFSHFDVSYLVTRFSGVTDFFPGDLNENLEWFDFRMNYKLLNLTRNGGAFDNTPRLSTVNFENSFLLESIEDGMFAENHEMRHVNFAQCVLAAFDVSKIFSPQAKLEHVEVSGNEIAELSPNSFAGQSEVKFLNFANNKLSRISSNTFAGLSGLKRLPLKGGYHNER